MLINIQTAFKKLLFQSLKKLSSLSLFPISCSCKFEIRQGSSFQLRLYFIPIKRLVTWQMQKIVYRPSENFFCFFYSTKFLIGVGEIVTGNDVDLCKGYI